MTQLTRPSRPLNVLISEPQGIVGEDQFERPRAYLPYVWAVLKTHYEETSQLGTCRWLSPVWNGGLGDDVLARYGDIPIDVLGLSCYTWNWRIQCSIAEAVKAAHPLCLVVAGGPDPDYKDPEFFERHPYVDAIAVKDGEITFTRVLDALSRGDLDLCQIPGLYLPSPRGPRLTADPEVPRLFQTSPYAAQGEHLADLMKDSGATFDAVLETNRGCPYGCSFCDWGSNTMSKIRKFDIDRVKADLDWLGAHRIDRFMLVDANFGILPRDVEIADLINSTRDRHGGFPRYVFWSAAKNHPDRVVSIAEKLAESGVCTSHALSIQHTHPEVLAATARSNISPERQVSVVKALMESWVPIEVQLILGLPGDTPARWRDCLTDLMEWGIHEDYLVMTYRLLPNAPAAEPSYIEQWGLGWIDRVTHDLAVRDLAAPRSLLAQHERLVVTSSSYDAADWVQMATEAAFIKALHNTGLTQKLAVYLRLTHDIPYRSFYDRLLHDPDGPALLSELWEQVAAHYTEFLADEWASDHIPVVGVPGFDLALHPSYWLYVALCRDLDRLFAEIGTSLSRAYPDATFLDEVVRYQYQVVVTPHLAVESGVALDMSRDWATYFAAARGRDGSDSMPEPTRMAPSTVLAGGRRSGDPGRDPDRPGYYERDFSWQAGDPESLTARWIKSVVLGRNSAAINTVSDLTVSPVP